MSIRAEQKEKTRRAIMEAALKQIGQDKAFSNLSLREVAREAGIAPTSFYRHFQDLDELGLALVDEAGLSLRQLMRKARKRIAQNGGTAIRTSVETFLEFLHSNPNLFRLLLREKAGISVELRQAIQREIEHFVSELTEHLEAQAKMRNQVLYRHDLVAHAMVTIVFNQGADALDTSKAQKKQIGEEMISQLRMLMLGSELMSKEAHRRDD
ncbi:HTH-type transcriptional repressor FabR [Litoribrevibacter albus]|uniref:DNA-binding transcriptional regulator FabR n=1 Tax=Litoribrevibacter albus TaxID=1473156 RepID=A0AA37S7C3_9GAMM|nr:HTH-type transcriptional repressor FabR [Litoribrevibacter albus]GLQ29844.1 DNA-binding transcriptional regulator FabR [Litoribrevibacter albus]